MKVSFRSTSHEHGLMDKTRPHGLLRIIFFQNSPLLDSNSPPGFAYANSLKGMRIHKDGFLAHAEGWTKSLSGIGHLAKMPQILWWGQLWFGLGTIPEHEPRARVLSESRTRQFSGSRSRWFSESEIQALLFASFPAFSLIIHPCLSAPEQLQVR